MFQQFILFSGIGIAGTAVHYTALVGLVTLSFAPILASTAGAILGACFNYVLNHRFTFQSRRRHTEALPRFMAVSAVGLLLNGLVLELFIHGMDIHYLTAQLVATVTVLFWNFSLNRLWTFRAELRHEK